MSDRDNHKDVCNEIKKSRDRYDHEEQALHSHRDAWRPNDVFTHHVGDFWGLLETRDYMRARFGLVVAITKIKTYDAVNSALDHLMDMLRLNHSDNMGLRDIIPPLLLRLGRDQQCYDFVKWHQTTGQEGDHDWGDMSFPIHDIMNADVFEPVDYMCRIDHPSYLDLSQISAIALLKIKLLLDVETLKVSTVLGTKVPSEILDDIQSHIPRSTIISQNKDITLHSNYAPYIEKLSSQVVTLYQAIERANGYFWRALLDPDTHVNARPESYSPGSLENTQITLRYSIDAWMETPGALEFIKAMVLERPPPLFF